LSRRYYGAVGRERSSSAVERRMFHLRWRRRDATEMEDVSERNHASESASRRRAIGFWAARERRSGSAPATQATCPTKPSRRPLKGEAKGLRRKEPAVYRRQACARPPQAQS